MFPLLKSQRGSESTWTTCKAGVWRAPRVRYRGNENIGWDATLARDTDGCRNMDDVNDGRNASAARDRWSMKMRGLQGEARVQLAGRTVLREEVTALVKKARSDSAG